MRSAILYDLYPPTILNDATSGRPSWNDDIARDSCGMRSPYCFSTPPLLWNVIFDTVFLCQLKMGEHVHFNIYLVLWKKWRENLGSPLSASLCKVFEELIRSH